MTFPDKEDQLKKRLAALDEEKQKLLQELAAIDIQKQVVHGDPPYFCSILDLLFDQNGLWQYGTAESHATNVQPRCNQHLK